MQRELGEVNFYLSQFLTGHGYFRDYLYRMGRVQSPHCKHCGNQLDTAEHTFFQCTNRKEKLYKLEETTGSLTPENIVDRMLRNEKSWNAISHFIESVLRAKKEEGCLSDSV